MPAPPVLERLRAVVLEIEADGHANPTRLAVAYCEHYDARYGQDLNGPSRTRLEELCDFITGRVEREAERGPQTRV